MNDPRILNTKQTHADPAALVLHGANPRKGDLAMIVESFRANGFWGSVVVDERNEQVLAGNHRVLAARELGWEEIPVTYIRPDSDEHALRILLADNRTSDIGTYDNNALAELLDHLASTDAGLVGTGYSTEAYGELLASFDMTMGPANPANDPNAEWAGMPEYEHEDKTAYRELTLRFPDEKAVSDFSRLTGQTITEKTKYVWYPEPQIERYADKRYAVDA